MVISPDDIGRVIGTVKGIWDDSTMPDPVEISKELRHEFCQKMIAALCVKGRNEFAVYLNTQIVLSSKELREVLFSRVRVASGYNERVVRAAETMLGATDLNRGKIAEEQTRHFYRLPVADTDSGFPVCALNRDYMRTLAELVYYQLNDLHQAYSAAKSLVLASCPEASEWLCNNSNPAEKTQENNRWNLGKLQLYIGKMQRSASSGAGSRSARDSGRRVFPSLVMGRRPAGRARSAARMGKCSFGQICDKVMRKAHEECVAAVKQLAEYVSATASKRNIILDKVLRSSEKRIRRDVQPDCHRDVHQGMAENRCRKKEAEEDCRRAPAQAE